MGSSEEYAGAVGVRRVNGSHSSSMWVTIETCSGLEGTVLASDGSVKCEATKRLSASGDSGRCA